MLLLIITFTLCNLQSSSNIFINNDVTNLILKNTVYASDPVSVSFSSPSIRPSTSRWWNHLQGLGVHQLHIQEVWRPHAARDAHQEVGTFSLSEKCALMFVTLSPWSWKEAWRNGHEVWRKLEGGGAWFLRCISMFAKWCIQFCIPLTYKNSSSNGQYKINKGNGAIYVLHNYVHLLNINGCGCFFAKLLPWVISSIQPLSGKMNKTVLSGTCGGRP